MPIQKNTNAETDLIIGNLFPQDNEDTFATDAANQRAIATNIRELQEQITQAKKVIAETMSGQTATGYLESLDEQGKNFQTAAESHDMVAEGLEVTANNIAVTKANMNHVDDTFHENMENLKQWGVSTGQVQETMTLERGKLVDEAKDSIRKGETELSSFQQDAITNLNAGNPVGSHSAFRLNEGASSNALIDAKGAGTAGTVQTSSSSVKAGGVARGVLNTQGSAGQKRFNSSDSSTSLSSTILADVPSTAASTSGVVVPGSITSSQNNPSNAPGSTGPVMTPGIAGLGAMAGNAGGAGAGTTGSAGTPSRLANSGSSRIRTQTSKDAQPVSSQWSEAKNEAVRIAATLWQNLASMGWEMPVAVAHVRDKGQESYVWATNFGASFIPDVITTLKAHPLDLRKVDAKVAQRIMMLPASMALDLWLQHTGIEVADRVVIAPKSDTIAQGFDRIDYSVLFSLSEQDLLLETRASSDTFAPKKYDNPIEKAQKLASKADHSIGEALQYAMYAQISGGAEFMPDGTSLSAAGYLREAIYATLKMKLDAGDEEGYHFLIWQAEQFGAIA